VSEGGVTKPMSKGEAIVKRLFSGALTGDLRATALISALSRDAGTIPPASEAALSSSDRKQLYEILGGQRMKSK
jgi:hypothetical protein